MAHEISVTQARADLADLVNRVAYSGERITLTRHGKPLAAIVPVTDLDAMERRTEVGFGLTPIERTDPAGPGRTAPAEPARVTESPRPAPSHHPRSPGQPGTPGTTGHPHPGEPSEPPTGPLRIAARHRTPPAH